VLGKVALRPRYIPSAKIIGVTFIPNAKVAYNKRATHGHTMRQAIQIMAANKTGHMNTPTIATRLICPISSISP
jgi:hypothetical protein